MLLRMTKRKAPRGKSYQQLQRRSSNTEPHKYILIVVEGKKTEYNYFNSLVVDLRLNTTTVKISQSSGGDPLVVVYEAMKLIEQNKQDNQREGEPKYDEIFCVFDEDGKSDKFQEACQQSVKIENCKAITSIPCFELWFLLHYRYTTKPFKNCTELNKDLESCLKREGILKKREQYDKSNPNWYAVLKPRINDAIANSKRLAGQNDGYYNPFTNVHELVEKLRSQQKTEEEEKEVSVKQVVIFTLSLLIQSGLNQLASLLLQDYGKRKRKRKRNKTRKKS